MTGWFSLPPIGQSETSTPGIGAAAFHGAIRTAYALESASRTELAHALAYWAAEAIKASYLKKPGPLVPA